jgi:hypothetical protein
VRVVSEEHGEKFCTDIFQMEKRYGGKWCPNMFADYCWSLRRQTPTGEYNKKRMRIEGLLMDFCIVRVLYIYI